MALLFIAVFLEISILGIVFININKIKFQKKTMAAILSLIAVALIISSYIFPVEFAAITANISAIFIMSVATYKTLKIISLSILCSVLSCIVFILSGYLAGVVLQFTHGSMTREIVLDDWFLSMFYAVMILTIAFVTSRWTGIFLHKNLAPFSDELKKSISKFLLTGAFITLAIFFMIIFLHNILTDTPLLYFAYGASLVTIFAFLIFAIFAFAGKIHKDELLESLKAYTDNVENMAKEMRKFQHDHTTLMSGFYDYIQNNDIHGITDYYRRYMISFNESTATMYSHLDALKNIKNPEIKGILSLKLLHAQHQGTNVHIEIPHPIEIEGEDIQFNLGRTVGILIDNAVESAQKAEISKLQILVVNKDHEVLFVIMNTFDTLPPVNEIGKPGFTTKEGHKGLGLHMVYQIISKDETFSINTRIDGGFFIQELYVQAQINISKVGFYA